MKKYTPSVKNNNNLKEQAVNSVKAFLFRLEKGKFEIKSGDENVDAVASQIKDTVTALENAVGTGEEFVELFAQEAEKQLKELTKQAQQSLLNRFESVAEDLCYTLSLWKETLDGSVSFVNEEEIEKEKLSRARRKLSERLAELEKMKGIFSENQRRLENEISCLEKDLAEYDEMILKEENERKINDIYRSVKAAKSKIDMLSIRNSNYSACFNLLDMIYSGAKEMLQSSALASNEIGKAKALLNIERLRKVISEPDKAVAILKRMKADMDEMAQRTATLDKKIFDLDSGSVQVSADALQYKEELMKKRREKTKLNNAGEELQPVSQEKKTIKTEEK